MTVEYNAQKVHAQLLVFDTCGLPLLGRDWLKLIRIDFPCVFHVDKAKREEEPPVEHAENLTPATKVKFQTLLDKYAEIFGRIETSCAPARDICSCAMMQCCPRFAARSRRHHHMGRATTSFCPSHGVTGLLRSSLSWSINCGHCASARGLHKTSVKIDAIRDASGMHGAQKHIDQIRHAAGSLSESQLPADLSTSLNPEAPALAKSRPELGGAESTAVTDSHTNQKLLTTT